MERENHKEIQIDYETSIQKSNQFSMAKLNQGLSLNQMQLLAYAIFSTQQDGKTQFRKYEFQNKFDIEKYQTSHAREDAQKLLGLQFSIIDLENDYFEYWNVFGSIKYKDGAFGFKWNDEFIPHILKLKEKYVTTDLTITSRFKSGFSWILYDYLKAHYGYCNKELTREALMKLFAVENRKSYIRSTAQFKRGVLDVAIKEINKLTEMEVWYSQKKTGTKITGFTLHWLIGSRKAKATNKQITLLHEIHNKIEKNMFDYLALKNQKNREKARINIIKIKRFIDQTEGLTSEQADKIIKESRVLYNQLQGFLRHDKSERDTSFYYNWLEDIEH